MSVEDEDSTWLLALESALHEGVDDHELVSITRGRVLPEEHRAQASIGEGRSNFTQFDEIFDLQEQSTVRQDCRTLVDKLGNEEEDKVSVICDVESIFTHYCKSRHLKYDPTMRWADIVLPLLAGKMPRDHIYICFEEILEKYIPRESGIGGPVYHLLRLLLLYHDPELSTFLDSRKITPDLYATSWVTQILLFVVVCSLDSTMAVWDIYFQERDPFFILFLALVILVNASGIPSGLSVDDVSDFCSLARYYVVKTPATFRKDFSTVIFGSVYMGHGDMCNRVRFFLIDCRPSDQYNAGHLPNAFHLDSSLMLQHQALFQTAVQGLFMAQRQAVASETPGCGQHLCFVGSGREQEDQYVHMVVASFLQHNTQYYITNPNGEGLTIDRHVSALDRGRPYRNLGDVFGFGDDDGENNEENERLEVVKISQWLKKPDFISSFTCNQVKENGYMYKCHLLLMETLLFIVRESENKDGEGHVTARRTLASIVKITSKKRHPDLITFKYGTTSPEGEVTISDMDRQVDGAQVPHPKGERGNEGHKGADHEANGSRQDIVVRRRCAVKED
ncbi:TBC1 domain family member 23-like [Homarus americanus]|uniref:TBC1 domain family member 23 n=1 Tax=Homarus americanus TaxID=6706 RepID=A0A8J5MJ94_HOMAM|nr:TBC1 domain family member 23-like [Homarus americanus]